MTPGQEYEANLAIDEVEFLFEAAVRILNKHWPDATATDAVALTSLLQDQNFLRQSEAGDDDR